MARDWPDIEPNTPLEADDGANADILLPMKICLWDQVSSKLNVLDLKGLSVLIHAMYRFFYNCS